MPERKTLNEDLFYRGSSANLPRLHTCKNKVPFWDFRQFAVTHVYFEMFHGTFLLFHIHIEQFAVISIRSFIILLLLRQLIPIYPRNWFRVPAMKRLAPISTALTVMLYPSFSSSFLRSSYLLVLHLQTIHIYMYK